MSEVQWLRLCWGRRELNLTLGSPALWDAIHHIYRPFVTGASASKASQPEAAPSVPPHLTCLLNDRAFSYRNLSKAVEGLTRQVAYTLLGEPPNGLLLHAAAVEQNARTLVLLGPSGAGKTTMAMELVSRGFQYLGDEFVAISNEGTVISPFPRSAMLKDPRFEPPRGQSYSVRKDGAGKRYHLPEHRSSLEPRPLKETHLVFLSRQSRVRATPLNAGEIVASLIPQTFDYLGRSQELWPTMSGLAGHARACFFEYSDAQRDLSLVLEALDLDDRSPP